MKLEGLFYPELPGAENKHKMPQSPRSAVGTFPYSEPDEDVISDEEAERQVGLVEFFGLGKTQHSNDNLKGLGKNSDTRGSGGRSAHSFSNYMKNDVDNDDADFTGVMKIGMMNYGPEEEKEDLDNFLQSENLSLLEIIRNARSMATKEMAPSSTKQPWANGMPSSQDNPYMASDSDDNDVDEFMPIKDLENETGLNLESLFKEYADTDWSEASKMTLPGEEDDLNFFDKISNSHALMMNSEEEFNHYQKTRKVVNDEED